MTSRETYFARESENSDSEATPYLNAIDSILGSDRKLINFRREITYREILEHVNYQMGVLYKNRIELLLSPEKVANIIALNKHNDEFGNPITFNFKPYGKLSPTTLRYVATALEISQEIQVFPTMSIVEIGCGYGGQASVLNRMFGVLNYTCFDLDPVLDLIEIYLKMSNSNLQIRRGELTKPPTCWDLAISNYAFSELKRELQIEYLEKVLTKCNSGYMIMNSGRTNETGRSKGKLSINEIREYLPDSKVKEEIPLTGPDNYVLYWQN